jgi:hypothetical protein
MTTVPQNIVLAERAAHKRKVALVELESAAKLIREASEHLVYVGEMIVEVGEDEAVSHALETLPA